MEEIFYYKGLNPSVCTVVFSFGRVLLVKRGKNNLTDPGKYSFPGGHHDTLQPRGSLWKQDKETSVEAAARELREETGLSVPLYLFEYIGDFKETKYSNDEYWSITSAFFLNLPSYINNYVYGMDDAEEAGWFNLSDALNCDLAFNNKEILSKAVKKLGNPYD